MAVRYNTRWWWNGNSLVFRDAVFCRNNATINAHVKTQSRRNIPGLTTGLTHWPVTRPDKNRWPSDPWPGNPVPSRATENSLLAVENSPPPVLWKIPENSRSLKHNYYTYYSSRNSAIIAPFSCKESKHAHLIDRPCVVFRTNLPDFPLYKLIPTGYGKWVVAYGLRGEGLVWLIEAVVCLLAANRGSNCSLTRATDGRIVRCGIISSCQSAAISEIAKRFWSRWLT